VQIEVLIKNRLKREMLLSGAKYFAKRLKIKTAAYGVIIVQINELQSTGSHALINEVEPGLFAVAVGRGSIAHQLQYLAHEMVHARQMLRGDLVYDISRQRHALFWKGEDLTHLPFHEQPWEIEAMKLEVLLAQEFYGKLKLLAEPILDQPR